MGDYIKLEKYENKKGKRTILISISVIVLIVFSFLLYKSFASFTESVDFPIMKGKVDYFGNSDIYFAFYKGDEQLDTMPQKDNEKNLILIMENVIMMQALFWIKKNGRLY